MWSDEFSQCVVGREGAYGGADQTVVKHPGYGDC